MRRISILLLVLLFSVSAYAETSGARTKAARDTRPGPCSAEKRFPAHFQNQDTEDHIAVSITGPSCSDAVLRIEITSDEGEILYSYEGNLMSHVRDGMNDRQKQVAARNLVDLTVELGFQEKTSGLPEYQSADDFHQGGNRIEVGREYYEELRMANRPVFVHMTGIDRWSYVVYDETQGKGVVFMTGSR